MNWYEIIILALSCFGAGYIMCYVNMKGDENERSSGTDDEVRND